MNEPDPRDSAQHALDPHAADAGALGASGAGAFGASRRVADRPEPRDAASDAPHRHGLETGAFAPEPGSTAVKPEPARRPEVDLRNLLPGVEPERHVDDWGRSERVYGLFDRTVFDFLYRYWFRVEVTGIENVPSSGGALLVANHAGALPPDAIMIAKAVSEEHPRPRPLHLTVEHWFKGYPGFSMLVPKLGGVPAHPANVHRLLYDEQRLVLVFPEGRKGTAKLYRDRYRLQRFGRGGFVAAAMRARVPIVPVAVVGAEEAQPTFAQLRLLRRLTGLLYFPVTPAFPQLGPLGILAYLPAKFRIRFGEPIPTDGWGERPWEDPGLVQTVAQEVRGLIQESVLDLLAKRRSIWR